MTADMFRKNRLWERLQSLWGSIAYYAAGLYHRVGEHHIFLMAGGLTFSLFVCIIPLVLIVFAGLGIVLEKPSITQEINSFIENVIPYTDFAKSVKQLVFPRVNEFTIYKNLAGIIGIAGLFFAASSLFSSMRTTLNTIYRVSASESVLIGKLRDLGLVLLVLAYFLISTMILPIMRIIEDFAEKSEFTRSLNLDFLGEFALNGFSILIIFISFFIVYYFIPYKKPPQKAIVVSAVSASLLWLLAERVFGFYITNIVTLKRIYGAYFFMIVVAFWIYYTSLVFILGAEIGQLFRERKEKH
jgi:membrane protein